MPEKTPNTSKAISPPGKRKLKAPAYKSFRLQKRIKHSAPAVSGGFRILGRSLKVLGCHWKLFGGIVLIYGLLQIMLVQGFGAASDVNQVKDNAEAFLEGDGGLTRLAVGLSSFGYLLSSSGAGSTYQMLIVLITSLALIWALRQVGEGDKPRIRDGFYRGMYPFVQFVLVLAVVALQALPMVIVVALLGMASGGGLITSGIEQLLWLLLTLSAVVLTLYMLASSLFALYIVTLPGMTPLRALRTARELVRYRRWTVMRRVIFLPVVVVTLTGLLVVPMIIFAAPLAAWLFLAASFFGLAVIHSYMYSLFKELLG